MKTILMLAGSILIGFGLMILQIRAMRKYHPNAELLIGILKRIAPESNKNN